MRNTALIFWCTALLFVTGCKKESNPDPVPPVIVPTTPGDNDHILLGNPTNAQPNAGMGNNYFKDNKYYKIGYSSSRGIPVWVSWHLQSSDLGSTPRQDDFRPDTLPSAWYAVTNASYSSSGFDRGHNCPSDREVHLAIRSSREHQLRVLEHLTRAGAKHPTTSADTQPGSQSGMSLIVEVSRTATKPASRPQRLKKSSMQADLGDL